MSTVSPANPASTASPTSPTSPASPARTVSSGPEGAKGAPERIVGRWGEALLAPDAPSEVAQAVLESLGGPTGPLAPGDRRAWGPADLACPTSASATTADEPVNTTRLRRPEDAPSPVVASETAGSARTYQTAIPPTFPPQTTLNPASALPVEQLPPVLRPNADGDTDGGARTDAATGPLSAGPPTPETAESPASPAPSCASGAETGVWVDPDDLPMGIEPGNPGGSGDPGGPGIADALANRGTPGAGPDGADGPDGPAESASVLSDFFARYPEPEPGSGRRRRRAAADASSSDSSESTVSGAAESGEPARTAGVAADGLDQDPSPASFTRALTPAGAPGPEASGPFPSSSSATGALPQEAVPIPMVTAAICVVGHANPPDAHVCLCCPAPLSGQLIPVPRPVLAMLTLSTGVSVPVRGDIVIGRAPSAQPGGEPGALLLEVPSPTHLVSRSHLSITTAGWNVLTCDLSSNNGTVLLRPGMPAVLLAAALPTPLYVGDLLDVGDGVILRVEPPI